MQIDILVTPTISSINSVALNSAGEVLSADELRQRACSELLRQTAIDHGLLSEGDVPGTDGILSEEAARAIETLLEQNLVIPDPTEDECRRHHAAHQAFYVTGEQVNARHILFAVTEGVDVVALRNRAETTLLDVRCHDGNVLEDRFAKAASTQSNCPSGAEGGMLGWLSPSDCAPEFAKEIFGHAEVGVLPRLVHSRFGFHIVEVLERRQGVQPAYAEVRERIAGQLAMQSRARALHQYMALLAGEAELRNIALNAADSPLVQ